MEIDNRLKMWIAKRDLLFGRLQKMYDDSQKINIEANLRNFKARCVNLENTKQEFNVVIEKINELMSLDETKVYVPDLQALESFDELYCHIKSVLEGLKQSEIQTGHVAVANNSSAALSRAIPRLPQLPLINFSGEDLSQFPVFKECFLNMIHHNADLTSTDKVHYLVGSLRGKALSVCSGIPTLGCNYNIIWDALCKKYDDKRLLSNVYLDKIFNLKQLQTQSFDSLNGFLIQFDSTVNALKKLDIADLADCILAYLALKKLDHETVKLFENSRRDTELPLYDDIIKFVQEQAKICSRSSNPVKVNSNNHKACSSNNNGKQRISHSFVSLQNGNSSKYDNKCVICKEAHLIHNCSKFLQIEPTERYKIVRLKNLCLNCFGHHKLAQCKSKTSCKFCNLKHNWLLCFKNANGKNNSSSKHPILDVDATQTSSVQLSNSSCEGTSQAAVANATIQGDSHNSIRTLSLCSTGNIDSHGSLCRTVLLGTVQLDIIDHFGQRHKVRAILDSASQQNIISSRCCKLLNLPISNSASTIQTLGQSSTVTKGLVNIVVGSRANPLVRYAITALVVDKIIDRMPLFKVNLGALSHISSLPLADNEFHIPAPVDLILGSQIFPHLLGQRRVYGQSSELPVAVETALGFVIMGTAPAFQDSNVSHTFCTLTDISLNKLVERFWELESIPSESHINLAGDKCEEIYRKTYYRDCSGRYVVELPFKCSPTNLGNSYSLALRRFHHLEKKFRLDPSYKEQYCTVMQEYLDEGYMKKVINPDLVEPHYFIPHHGILKPNSSFPLRVVMDSSAKTDTSFSLNDLLYSGPKLQQDVLTLFLNFRLFRIGLTADIRRMYLKIGMCEKHTRFQRILWRFSEEDEISIYELQTVIFGVTSSPWLALRTVHQLVEDEAASYPLAATVAVKSMYMDDFLYSVDSVSEGEALYKEMVGLFKAGHLELAKWAVNSKIILDKIPLELRAPDVINFEKNLLNVLGLQWQPHSDNLSFQLKVDTTCPCTKRNILSTLAKFFDPLGLIAPVTLKLKLFIKELWLHKIGWDETPPYAFIKKWKQFERDLHLLANFKISRHLFVCKQSVTMLVGFADACESSYGALVYMRTHTAGTIHSNLICAKSKVAPLKSITIPRLELLAATLLAKLIDFLVKVFQSRLCIQKIYALSDSTITLSWINSPPHRWKVFVANRVSIIQNLVPASSWYHVNGVCNISDPLSRGLDVPSFLSTKEWVCGPSWLSQEESSWPIRKIVEDEHTSLEQKTVALVLADSPAHPLYSLVNRCSSWNKLVRTTVYVLRFAHILSSKNLVSASDLRFAEDVLIKVVQQVHFSNEIKLLEKTGNCSSSFRKLRPFLKDGLLRVGGRLMNSQLDYDGKHPILLPKIDRFVELLVRHYHNTHLHTGPSLVLSLLRQRFWILSGRRVVRSILSKCNTCFKLRPTVQPPLMANLPSYRVEPCKPFLKTGCDFAGPLNIILNRYRGTRTQKAYICLFICLATKAIHLELVSDLSTANFLQAFKRFLARRGLCTTLYTDHGSNFIGAKTALKDIYKLLASQEFEQNLMNLLANRGIEWKMIPPSAPHMGGIWESNIKNVKTHLYKVVGAQLLTYEEMNTLLIQIEAVLNSRPLCILTSEPGEITPLTPAHFLTLTPLDRLPSADLTQEKLNRLTRYQLIDQLVQHFWRRWSVEYLHTLQTRERWNTDGRPVKIGTIVLLQQPHTPPLHWPLGRIVEVHPGTDGVVRVVTVKTKNGIYTRPVVKVCPLPTQ